MNLNRTSLLAALFALISFQLSAQTITTVAGSGPTGFMMGSFSGDGGPATTATLSNPAYGCFDTLGNLYIPDNLNDRVRKVTPGGIITTVAGNGSTAPWSPGIPATAAGISGPSSVSFDKHGNMYIATPFVIHKVNPAGIITNIAGAGFGFGGDGGPAIAALFNNADRAIVDDTGNILICDWGNNRLRKIDTFGIIRTIAGNGSMAFSGDGGPATAAGFTPGGFFIDSVGNIIICDSHNNRIRRISAATGIITTIAGTGTPGFSGDGGPASAAQFTFPSLIVPDGIGNYYVADENNHRIRKINSAGVITTIAGTGIGGFSGDGGSPTAAQLYYPHTITKDGCGNLYIFDLWNHRVRRIVYSVPMASFSSDADTVCKDSCITAVNLTTSAADSIRWTFSGPGAVATDNADTITRCFATPGTYTVNLTAFGNCAYTNHSQTVLVKSSPSPVITVSGSSLSVPPVYASYQWHLSGTPIPGATNNTYIYSTPGVYTVKVDSGSCPGMSAMAPLSVNGPVMEASEFWLSYDGGSTAALHSSRALASAVNVIVSDVAGRRIFSSRWSGNAPEQIPAHDLQPGLYLVRLENEHTAVTLKWLHP
ncbi:MAG: hypothetical protein KF744_04685 [Taibaiella sp.]|nr:hypothetical protein [Taibaiella sp.]